MITAELLHAVAHAEGQARTEAFTRLAAAAGNPAAYQVVLATLSSSQDERVLFWCLDALIKRFGTFLPADATHLFPLLLPKLVEQTPPITDRAIWALNIVGPASVLALLSALHEAPSTSQRMAYVFALGRNKHVHVHLAPVIMALAHCLQDADANVRYWAMVTVMDLSPLRPFYIPPLPSQYFEPLYPLVMSVAAEFMVSDQEEFAERYHDLIAQHWAL